MDIVSIDQPIDGNEASLVVLVLRRQVSLTKYASERGMGSNHSDTIEFSLLKTCSCDTILPQLLERPLVQCLFEL